MKNISNYHDLVAEKHRVQQRLELLKRDVDNEIHEIKEKFRPLTRIVGMFTGNGAHQTDDDKKPSLLKMGGNLAVDLLIGPRLAKAGVLTRLVVPPLLRGISSRLFSRFRKKK